MKGPLGHFVDPRNRFSYEGVPRFLCISIGSGLTPIYSLYRAWLHEDEPMYIANIFGERHRDQVLPSVHASFQPQISHETHHIRHRCCLSKQKNIS